MEAARSSTTAAATTTGATKGWDRQQQQQQQNVATARTAMAGTAKARRGYGGSLDGEFSSESPVLLAREKGGTSGITKVAATSTKSKDATPIGAFAHGRVWIHGGTTTTTFSILAQHGKQQRWW